MVNTFVTFLCMFVCSVLFVNDTATTEIYTYLHTLSLHDALPISKMLALSSMWLSSRSGGLQQPPDARDEGVEAGRRRDRGGGGGAVAEAADRKSTRLNSSH